MSKEQLSEQDLADIQEARAAYQDYLKSMQAPAPQEQESGVEQAIRSGLDIAGRTLDVPFGLVRTGMAATMEPFVENDVVRGEDVIKALMGEAPSYEEYLVRAGYDPESYLTKGAGLAGEIVSGMGGEEALARKAPELAAFYAPKIITSTAEKAGKGLKGLGAKVYESAFEKIDDLLENKFGKEGISKILKEERFKGGKEAALKKTQELQKQYGEELGAMRDFAESRAEARVKMPEKIPLAENIVGEYRGFEDPASQKIAANLEEILTATKSTAQKSAKQLAKEKGINKELAGSENALFNMLADPTRKAETKLRKAIGVAQNEAEEAAMLKAVGPEGLKQYQDLKDRYGVVSSFTQRELAKDAAREANRTGVMPSAWDTVGGVAAALYGDPKAMAAMAAKKGRDILRMTPVKTRMGLGMEDLGGALENASPYITSPMDAAARSLWIELLKQEQEKQK